MIESMATITCPHCDNRFETSARSGRTRCGNCRKAVTVPKERAPEVLVLLLSCGHVSMHFDEGVPPSDAEEWLWTCIECEAEEQEAVRVITTMTGEQVESMTDEQFAALIENALARSGARQ